MFFSYYAPELFKNAGVGSSNALMQTVILGGINVCLTIFSMALVDRLWSKTIVDMGHHWDGLQLVRRRLCVPHS